MLIRELGFKYRLDPEFYHPKYILDYKKKKNQEITYSKSLLRLSNETANPTNLDIFKYINIEIVDNEHCVLLSEKIKGR